jgi:hypothetical protein
MWWWPKLLAWVDDGWVRTDDVVVDGVPAGPLGRDPGIARSGAEPLGRQRPQRVPTPYRHRVLATHLPAGSRGDEPNLTLGTLPGVRDREVRLRASLLDLAPGIG